MMRWMRTVFLLAGVIGLGAGSARTQPPPTLPVPRLFMVMPCGGKAGTTVDITFSGQDLEEPQALLFSHPGIKAAPIVPPAPKPADPKQKPPPPPPVTQFKVTIPADVPVGCYDVRLVNKWGVSNPRVFAVGDLAEAAEKEPNNDVPMAQRVEVNTTVNGTVNNPVDVDYFAFAGKKGQKVIVSCLASTLDSRLHAAMEVYDSAGRMLGMNRYYNGTVNNTGTDALVEVAVPADGDYYIRLYQFTHTEGSADQHFYRLTVTTAPWIDAVVPPVVEPGKPANLTVYGRNLPGGQPDPTAVLDGQVLEKAVVQITAPADPMARQRLVFGGRVPAGGTVLDGFEYRIKNAAGTSNPYLLTFARSPVVVENGANDKVENAQAIAVPCEIAGRVEKRRDKDWYAFAAKQGQVFSITGLSERPGAPTDLFFTVRNPATKQGLGEFDDDTDTLNLQQLHTASADPPRFRFVAPADGTYQLMITSQDSENRFGPRHLYQVRIAPEQPDFRVVLMPFNDNSPGACVLGQAGNQAFEVFVWRLDGFAGAVTLVVEGLPPGVTCAPQTVGPVVRQTTLVLTAAADAKPFTGPLKVSGTAVINGQKVAREARPATITWPVQPQANIPAITRLDRGLYLAVRDKAPFVIGTKIDKATVVQGDKANLALTLTRVSPDFKSPLTVTFPTPPLPNIAINNNQPLAIAANANSATVPVVVNANVPPGTYSFSVRGLTQYPYNKDPMAKQKNPINVLQVSAPVTLTVQPKQLATVALNPAAPTVKVGMTADVIVKVARMYDFAGEFKVELVLPAGTQGISAAAVTIPAGKDEAKLVLKADANAAVGARANLSVKAVAVWNGNVPVTHETPKFNVNVVK